MLRFFRLVALLLLPVVILGACAGNAEQERQSVHIVMTAPEGMGDAQKNYYRCWLEERSGLAIELELISPDYTDEYLRLLFANGGTGVDAVFFSPGLIPVAQIEQYGREGALLPLNALMEEGTSIKRILADHKSYDLLEYMTCDDGNIYYMPNLQYSGIQRSQQTLWLNVIWLKETGMSMPQNTDEFREVMQAFQRYSQSRGESAQPVTVASSDAVDNEMLYHYLMNAFVYTDPQHSYLMVENGAVRFAPVDDAWREGLRYCRELWEAGLLPDVSSAFSHQQLVRITNDPRDLIGGFTAESVTDVLLQSSPELLNRYVHIPPLEGPEGDRLSTVRTELPQVGGIITAGSGAPEAAFQLMDLMLSEQAYLIAAFGEEGVDWDYARPGDISLSGAEATITIKSHAWDLLNNKHFNGAGPFVTDIYYGDGVAWNGYQADQRYLDARAGRVYREYEPPEYIHILSIDEGARAIQKEIEGYAREMMAAFICGDSDPADNAVWRDYQETVAQMGIDDFLKAAQRSYDQFHRGEGG